jgi:hypothetical protein
LKIDVEGHDFEVLKGGIGLIEGHSIDFIQVEVGLNPKNCLHVRFEEVKTFLEQRNYYLFGLYELTREKNRAGCRFHPMLPASCHSDHAAVSMALWWAKSPQLVC